MGQRHQIYIITKDKNQYQAVGAFHHQWLYGHTAAINLVNLVEAAQKAKTAILDKWSEYSLYDAREVDVLVKGTTGINHDGSVSMVHNEAEYLIEDGKAYPSRGDNNDGCTLVVIDNDKQEVRGCLFMLNAFKSLTPKKYFDLYYNAKELKEIETDKESPKWLTARVAKIQSNEVKQVTTLELKKIFKHDISIFKRGTK